MQYRIALLLLLTSLGFAQRPQDGGTRQMLVSISISSKPNAPFSANVNTQWARLLGDGTTITLVNHRAVARDSAGRVFQERRLLVPEDGKRESFLTQIEIRDPLAGALYMCNPSDKTCQVKPVATRNPRFTPNPGPTTGAEQLGTSAIGGLETIGTRQTNVIQAGLIGNNSPIRITRESWYSPQLDLNLISHLQDPRAGNQNFEVTNIAVGEPDPKLFQPPAEFKLIDLRNLR